jgi:uncharacterized membrane protein required for colicin V production
MTAWLLPSDDVIAPRPPSIVSGFDSRCNISVADPGDTPDVFVEEIASADESSNETPCRMGTARGPTMWLDVILGGIILIAGFRGWFRGFVSQAVRIAGLVACVYLAEPVRDYAKPHVLPHLPTIPAELVDRLLWWVSAAVVCVVLVGVASLVIKMTRRPEIPGIAQAGRNDQFAGFMLGATKGLLLAAFATAAIQKYAMEQVKAVPWAEEQVKASWSLQWSETYRPVPKIWSSRPVQHFVTYIERMGWRKPGDPSQSPVGEHDDTEDPPVRTASRPAESDTTSDPRRAGENPSTSTGFRTP